MKRNVSRMMVILLMLIGLSGCASLKATTTLQKMVSNHSNTQLNRVHQTCDSSDVLYANLEARSSHYMTRNGQSCSLSGEST